MVRPYIKHHLMVRHLDQTPFNGAPLYKTPFNGDPLYKTPCADEALPAEAEQRHPCGPSAPPARRRRPGPSRSRRALCRSPGWSPPGTIGEVQNRRGPEQQEVVVGEGQEHGRNDADIFK